MRELEYPFEAEMILKKKKSIRKQLKADETKKWLEKRIAILGGETTQDIKLMLELFLLNNEINPIFYESEFNQYYEEGMFQNEELVKFRPDIIYVCTCIRNVTEFPRVSDTLEEVERKRKAFVDKFTGLWENLKTTYKCPIIQNNLEYPFFRLMGNKDATDIHGRVNFVTMLNVALYEYAQKHDDFYICDINYLSASYGLEKWADPYYWYMYKYAIAVPAIPYLAFNVANIIKSIYGKNKKALNLDLDNTLWGGVIGDDGVENIEIGQETALAQTYSEFQQYIKLHKELGIALTVNSKNDEAKALSGFERPDSVLRREDFVSFKANWNPKSDNLKMAAEEMGLLPESFVFVDDNPREREIINMQISGAAIPQLSDVEHYIQILDKSGFFEVTVLSEDDMKRSEMYSENVKREELRMSSHDYEGYLRSLEMKGEIKSFTPMYLSRIAQLTNKSNQFNLTTKRYTQSEIEAVSENREQITLYGKLSDKFGDNGVVSVIIGNQKQDELHIELWLMSCRVLKREMEYAMMDELVAKAKEANVKKIIGYYYPTVKNGMVKDFYATQGFEKISEDEGGNTIWEFNVTDEYQKKQNVIEICE